MLTGMHRETSRKSPRLDFPVITNQSASKQLGQPDFVTATNWTPPAAGTVTTTKGALNQLLKTLGLELSQGIVFDGVTNFDGIAADLTIFDIAVTVNREVQDHRDLFAAKWTGEGMFHD